MAVNIAWREPEIEYLRRWWGTIPASRIAETLGRTRSSIIGAAHRAGLANLGNPVGKSGFKPTPEPRDAYRRRDENGRLKRSAKPARGKFAEPKPAPELQLLVIPRRRQPPPVDNPGTVRFRDLQPGQCRWIPGATVLHRADEALACGAPVAGVGCPYCAEHTARASVRRTAEPMEAACAPAA